MEAQQFDDLTKRLAAPVSRRTAVKAALVTAVGGVFGLGKVSGAAASCPTGYQPCGNRCVYCPSGTVNTTTCACCAPGTTPCGVYCSSCPSGTVLNGACQCVACPSGTTYCNNGTATCVRNCTGGTLINPTTCTCISCPSGQTLCNGTCVDTSTSNTNCGGCGITCPSGEACFSGVCQCPQGGQACTSGGVTTCVTCTA